VDRSRLALSLAALFVFTACPPAEEPADQPAAEMAAEAMPAGQVYPNLPVPTVFENARVVAQRLEAGPGVWAGEHAHAGNQLVVVLNGGTITYRQDGQDTETTYTDGQVFWVDAVAAHDHAAKDLGASIVLTLADAPAGGGMAQTYPNATPTVAFENDRAVAQRFTSEPGVWTGEHSHAGNQLVVVLKGGTIIYREAGQETEVTYTDGQVFWIDAVAAHDHASKDTGLDAVVITLK